MTDNGFDEWFNELVGFSFRSEWFYDDFDHAAKTNDYKKIVDLVPVGPNSYVVIMTFGHKSDETVLRQLLDKNVKYLGMMGSKRKVQAIFSSLLLAGASEIQLDKVDAPIGLSIGSQTPAEIAVSIAAKIIQVKNAKKYD